MSHGPCGAAACHRAHPGAARHRACGGRLRSCALRRRCARADASRRGSARCFACYRFRMQAAAELAKERACDYFTTTLSISPYKNAERINAIGEEIAEQVGVPHLPNDFKNAVATSVRSYSVASGTSIASITVAASIPNGSTRRGYRAERSENKRFFLQSHCWITALLLCS